MTITVALIGLGSFATACSADRVENDLMSDGTHVKQDSLRMHEVSELVGSWVVEGKVGLCHIRFAAARIETANAHQLDGAACLTPMLPRVAVGWRPAPDGIELVDADRLTIVIFADDGTGKASAMLPSGGKIMLRRE